MDTLCCAITEKGTQCVARAKTEGRCTRHYHTMVANGPNATAVKELGHKHKLQIKQLGLEYQVKRNAIGTEVTREEHNAITLKINEDQEVDLSALKIRQKHQKFALLIQQNDEIHRTGINPDAEAEQRKAEKRNRDREMRLAAIEGRIDEIHAVWGINPVGVVPAVVNPNENLQAFAADRQNIHTSVTVEKTKQIVREVLKIPVPEGYRWNTRECSKTPGEIVISCKLTPRAAWEMNARYCQEEEIYEMGVGIYGKVLDAVWQYIRESDDKEPLYRILKQEMEDNIGMCAQGNLSRLCNILAGYVDGIAPQESAAEILGREIPKLLELDDVSERFIQAQAILRRVNLPPEEWVPWLEALIDDENHGVEVRVRNVDGDVILTYT